MNPHVWMLLIQQNTVISLLQISFQFKAFVRLFLSAICGYTPPFSLESWVVSGLWYDIMQPDKPVSPGAQSGFSHQLSCLTLHLMHFLINAIFKKKNNSKIGFKLVLKYWTSLKSKLLGVWGISDRRSILLGLMRVQPHLLLLAWARVFASMCSPGGFLISKHLLL